MPNTGRPSRDCHSCRQRRIKCDLVRPECGQCLRKGQLCPGYRNEVDARFQIQTVYSFKNYMSSDRRKPYNQEFHVSVFNSNENSVVIASSNLGNGPSFPSHINKPSKAPGCVPSSMPFTPETGLAARWLSMTGPSIPGFKTLRPLGRWTNTIPLRIGSNKALDLAVAYVLDASAAHFHSNDAHGSSVLVSGPRATQSLRLAWETGDPKNSNDIVNLMLTVQLHFAAEVFRRLGAGVYFLHIRALSTLFKSCELSFLDTELAQSLFSSTIYEEVTYSYIAGIDSAFDDPSFLPALKSGILLWKSPIAPAAAFISEQLIQLPRALRLARSLRESHDPAIYLEAVGLIEKLYNDDCDTFIHGILENVTTLVSTRSPENAALVPESYHFESTYIFKLFTRYFSFQVLLYGIIEDLQRIYSLNIDMSAVRVKDVQAAQSIAMCVDHALNTYPAMGLLVVRLILPLQFSFFSWHRLERRSMSSMYTTHDYQRARQMKWWVVRVMNGIEIAWRTDHTSLETNEKVAEALSGGPQLKRLGRFTDPASIIASADEFVTKENFEGSEQDTPPQLNTLHATV